VGRNLKKGAYTGTYTTRGITSAPLLKAGASRPSCHFLKGKEAVKRSRSGNLNRKRKVSNERGGDPAIKALEGEDPKRGKIAEVDKPCRKRG